MLKISREKMKVSDEQNCQALCDINPKEAFHRIGLAGMARACKERRSAVRRWDDLEMAFP
jgi:hypothetical protein